MIIGTHIGSHLFDIIIMFNVHLTFGLFVITDNIFYLHLSRVPTGWKVINWPEIDIKESRTAKLMGILK